MLLSFVVTCVLIECIFENLRFEQKCGFPFSSHPVETEIPHGKVIHLDQSLWPIVKAATGNFWIVAFTTVESNKNFIKIFDEVAKKFNEKPYLRFGRAYCPMSWNISEVNQKRLEENYTRVSGSVYDEHFYDEIAQGSLNSATEIIPTIVNLVRPHSVCDVGCGSGVWLKITQEITGISDDNAFGFDFAVPSKNLVIKPSQYHDVDLTKPFTLGREFDLCISLEVGEHLDESSADLYVGTLMSLAPIILFSAAVPGQIGTYHVNCQWPSYWEEKFKKHRFFAIDCLRSKFWNNGNVEAWFRQNIVLFVREDKLLSLGLVPSASTLVSLMHPKMFLSACKKHRDGRVVNVLCKAESKVVIEKAQFMCFEHENSGVIDVELFHEGDTKRYSGELDELSLYAWLNKNIATGMKKVNKTINSNEGSAVSDDL